VNPPVGPKFVTRNELRSTPTASRNVPETAESWAVVPPELGVEPEPPVPPPLFASRRR
jgi:hypothetical protein